MKQNYPSKRKILPLTEKSFLSLRKKDLLIYFCDRSLPKNRKIAGLHTGPGLRILVTDDREIVRERFREWKKIFILNEQRV
jgi:hypothetical protein